MPYYAFFSLVWVQSLYMEWQNMSQWRFEHQFLLRYRWLDSQSHLHSANYTHRFHWIRWFDLICNPCVNTLEIGYLTKFLPLFRWSHRLHPWGVAWLEQPVHIRSHSLLLRVVLSIKMAALTADNINPGFKRIKYEIRGPLVVRAEEIEQELARVRNVFIIKLILYNGWTPRAKNSEIQHEVCFCRSATERTVSTSTCLVSTLIHPPRWKAFVDLMVSVPYSSMPHLQHWAYFILPMIFSHIFSHIVFYHLYVIIVALFKPTTGHSAKIFSVPCFQCGAIPKILSSSAQCSLQIQPPPVEGISCCCPMGGGYICRLCITYSLH